eukprot:CAMPEP_0174367456 /NCGR_PEP_ID=MMETSP0811_2-20130205/85376_1 /TAXON_ID=73025 ORGANISM="Eutreptiella gymnastica-like, Strain CCMP1594" /NCGR_SAMPLE_ID=MMETSP0811_2 /ASSEMBLY_ACC=CAM_ASM_000667 /LENGTH=60 /DNA_ID=CAMNT_0015510029 /DNA_START=154 /DNA_END=336 /DNA_ORIENTATION=-
MTWTRYRAVLWVRAATEEGDGSNRQRPYSVWPAPARPKLLPPDTICMQALTAGSTVRKTK